MGNLLVTAKDFRECEFCMKGVREFYSFHGLSFTQMLKTGTPIEDLENTQDLLALRVVKLVRGRSGR